MISLAPGTEVTPSVRLVAPLGHGGMGAVWRAEHLTLKAPVVVKFLADRLSTDPDAIARFSREAAAAAAVRSPHVVQMLDHGVMDGAVPFIVMELLEGEDLSHRLGRTGRMPPKDVLAIVQQTCRALARAHGKGIVHRDVKPANVFLCDVGGDEPFVKVLDFGIAKKTGEVGVDSVTGSMMGTLFYMSPEQLRDSKRADHRADLWAVGVMTYEMLVGERPFQADNVGGLCFAIAQDPVPVPSRRNPGLPKPFDAWFLRACDRDPAARFPDARSLADALQACFAGADAPSSMAVTLGVVPADASSRSSASAPMEAFAPTVAGPSQGRTTSPVIAAASPPSTMGPVSDDPARAALRVGTASPGRRRAPWIVGGAIATLALVGAVAFFARDRAASEGAPRPAASPATTSASATTPPTSGATPAPEATTTSRPAASAVPETPASIPSSIASAPKPATVASLKPPTTKGAPSAAALSGKLPSPSASAKTKDIF